MKSKLPVLKHNPVTNKMILCGEEENPAWIEEEQAWLEQYQAEDQSRFDALQIFLEENYSVCFSSRDIETIQDFIEQIQIDNIIKQGEA